MLNEENRLLWAVLDGNDYSNYIFPLVPKKGRCIERQSSVCTANTIPPQRKIHERYSTFIQLGHDGVYITNSGLSYRIATHDVSIIAYT